MAHTDAEPHRAPGLTLPRLVSAPGERSGARRCFPPRFSGPARPPPLPARGREASAQQQRDAGTGRRRDRADRQRPAERALTGRRGPRSPVKRRGRPHLGLKSWNKPRRFIAAQPSTPAALYQARMARPPPEPGRASPPRRSAPAGTGRPAPPRARAPPAKETAGPSAGLHGRALRMRLPPSRARALRRGAGGRPGPAFAPSPLISRTRSHSGWRRSCLGHCPTLSGGREAVPQREKGGGVSPRWSRLLGAAPEGSRAGSREHRRVGRAAACGAMCVWYLWNSSTNSCHNPGLTEKPSKYTF